VVWESASASRATETCSTASNGVGCFGATRNLTTANVNLLNTNEMFGEQVTTWDVKFAKNIRFSGKRAQIGVDIYNFFNSDAITSYNETYTLDNPATPTVEENHWGEPAGVVSPRFLRFQIQFDF
jgi:hypothetical protein